MSGPCDWFKRPKVFLVAGAPARGKTYLTRYFLQQFIFNKTVPRAERLQFGAVYGHPSSIEEYDWLPPQCTHEVMESKEIDSKMGGYLKYLVAENKRLNEKKGRVGRRHEVLLPPNFLVLDDIVGVLNSQSKTFNRFITTFRKTNTTVFICVQYINSNISTTVRQCIEYAIWFDFDNKKTIGALCDAFGTTFGSLKLFHEYIKPLLRKEYKGVKMTNPCVVWRRSEEDLCTRYCRYQAPSYRTRQVVFGGGTSKEQDPGEASKAEVTPVVAPSPSPADDPAVMAAIRKKLAEMS